MKLRTYFFGAVLLLTGCSLNQNSKFDNPVLSIEGGQVQGVVIDSANVIVYRGIPYAAPPVGDLRWKRPQPVKAWDTLMIADTFSDAAIQRIRNPKDGNYGTEFHFLCNDPKYSEDCLYLNVWTPVGAPGKSTKKLPVAMWVHGGAYSGGWGFETEMDGEAWAQRDVILVTINYRLSGFGFLNYPELSAEDPDGVSGNYGLLDQIAALKWIRNNISAFGGDPENITVFGQSAGGASIRNLCLSPMSKDLISKAIIQSGGGLSDLIPTNAKTQSELDAAMKEKLDGMGLTSLSALRALPSDTLYKVLGKLGWGRGISFAPHQDGVVLKQSFEEATYSGAIANIPYMIGYTADDMGDMSKPILNFAAVHDSVSHMPTYCYLFDRKLPDDGRPCLKGAFHSSELWFVFHTLGRSWRPFTEADFRLSDEMVDAWTNFAKYGNPNGKGGDAWTPATRENPYFHPFRIKE
jgi:para-nitrobenzyl esterase